MTHPWFAATGSPRVLAHRGLLTDEDAADGVVENSFAAVAAAHATGIAYVESDCRLTRDGTVVLFHDGDLRRLTGDPRPVADVATNELERLMAPRGGLLTLSQALDTFPTLRFNLDVKTEGAAVPVGRAVAAHGDRVLLTSFSDDRRRAALAEAASWARGIRPATSAGTNTIARVLAALAMRSRGRLRRALDGIDALQVPERHRSVRIVTPRLIDHVHRQDVEVHVWTVNAATDMRRLLDLGVDGLVTDRAEVAQSVVAEHR